jgi:hypothetical protein
VPQREIHLALKRTGSLVYWMPETEVRSRNDLSQYGYSKYYDAVVFVRVAGLDCKFALEYERTPKAARHYAAICERLEQETAIRHFLYSESRFHVVHRREHVALQACRPHWFISRLSEGNFRATSQKKRKSDDPYARICFGAGGRGTTTGHALPRHCRVIAVSFPCV